MKKIYISMLMMVLALVGTGAMACHFSHFNLISMNDLGGNQYEFTVEFCVGAGRSGNDFGAVGYTGTWGVKVDNGATVVSFPAALTSPFTGAVYTGYNNLYVAEYLIFGRNLTNWNDTWANVELNSGTPGSYCVTFTFITNGFPNTLELMGAEGDGVGVAPYGCNGQPDMIVDLVSPSVDAGADVEVIYGYGSNCTTLTAVATDGVGPYTYYWSNGATSVSTTVCPTSTTTYTVIVTDDNGYTATDDVTVEVNDIRCGNNKVYICHRGRTRCVRTNRVQQHLGHGDQLEPCNSQARLAGPMDDEEYGLTVYPNPTSGELELNLMMDLDEVADIEIFSIDGRKVMNVASGMEVFMDEMEHIHADLSSLESGIYFVSVRTQSGELMTEKVQLVK
jgi:hypothetical protein